MVLSVFAFAMPGAFTDAGGTAAAAGGSVDPVAPSPASTAGSAPGPADTGSPGSSTDSSASESTSSAAAEGKCDLDLSAHGSIDSGGLFFSSSTRLLPYRPDRRCANHPGIGKVLGTDRVKKVKLVLHSDPDIKLDMFATLDGRTALPSSFDRKTARTADSDNRKEIILDADDLPNDLSRVGVAIRAYEIGGSSDGGDDDDDDDGKIKTPGVCPSGIADDVGWCIEVITVRQPPKAVIVAPNQVRPDEYFDLDGSESVVPNGSGSYEWSIEGPGGSEDASGKVVENYELLTNGTWNVTLTVTGPRGYSDTATHTIEVSGPPVPDVVARAEVLTAQPAYPNQTVRFSGSDSYANEGEITSYKWSFGDGDSGSGVEPTTSYEEFTNASYEVTLTVETDKGSTDTDTVTVDVTTPNVWLKRVEGNTRAFIPDYLFSGCQEPILAYVEGTEPVDRVEFRLNGDAVSVGNASSSSGGEKEFRTKMQKLSTSGDDTTLEVVAVGQSGTTDSLTVAIETSDPPATIADIAKFIKNNGMSFNDTSQSGNTRLPVEVKPCSIRVDFPDIINYIGSASQSINGSGSGPDTGSGGELINPPTIGGLGIGAYMKFGYQPSDDQVTIEGGGKAETQIPPTGSRVEGSLGIGGDFSLPRWILQEFRMTGTIQGRIDLAAYFGIPEYEFSLPMTDFALAVDPVDATIRPKLQFRASIDSNFDFDSLTADVKGSIKVEGRVGPNCIVDTLIWGCLGGSIWGNVTVASDWMRVVPFEPTLDGHVVAGAGASLKGIPVSSPPLANHFVKTEFSAGGLTWTAECCSSNTGGIYMKACLVGDCGLSSRLSSAGGVAGTGAVHAVPTTIDRGLTASSVDAGAGTSPGKAYLASVTKKKQAVSGHSTITSLAPVTGVPAV